MKYMGRFAAVLFSVVIAVSMAYAEYILQTNTNVKKEISIPQTERKIDINESLEYSIEWLGIPSGRLTLAVEGIEKINGHDCYHIAARAKPNKFFARFYNVEYQVHSYTDKDTLCSRMLVEISKKKGRVRRRLYNLEEGQQDIVSGFYQFRFMNISPGGEYSIDVFYEGEGWPVDIKVEEPFLKEVRKKGELAVFGARMDTELNLSIFGQPKASVFFSADSQRIPVEFKFGTRIGVIRGIIKNHKVQKISF
jgi:hypothetical protein